MSNNKKYAGGDLFNINLGNKGNFLGLLTRRKGRTKLLAGYFWSYNNTLNLGTTLSPKDAILFAKFSGLGFEIGEWKLLGKYQQWDKKEWPFPKLVRYDELSGSHLGISYDDDFNEINEEKISEKKARTLFEDGTHGYLSLENCLTEVIKT